jgi:hypothetical protein
MGPGTWTQTLIVNVPERVNGNGHGNVHEYEHEHGNVRMWWS